MGSGAKKKGARKNKSEGVPLYFSSLSLLRTALHYLNAWNRLYFVRPGAHQGDGLLARMIELAFTLARFSAYTKQDQRSPKALDAKGDLEI